MFIHSAKRRKKQTNKQANSGKKTNQVEVLSSRLAKPETATHTKF